MRDSPESRANMACCVSGISGSESDMNVLRQRIAREITSAVIEERMILARALKKFAPDLMRDLEARHQCAADALDDFVEVLRN